MMRCFFVVLLLFCEAKETICLNMIVKNESPVIERCLDSVIPFIDYWVIVDTGSKDNTKKIIKKHLKNIPGELHSRKWKNFGENRTEAFNLAKEKGDYILLIDADDTLEPSQGFSFPKLDQDVYTMWRGSNGFTYLHPQLIRGNLPWRWVGVTHEYLSCGADFTTATLDNIRYVSGDGGHRSSGIGKFLENIRLLEEGLEQEPENTRYAFYLAESYRDAGQRGKALEWYQNRISRGDWPEEVFWSYLQIGHLLKDLGICSNVVIESYLNAYRYRPHRPEPIYFISEIYNSEQNYQSAYTVLQMGENIQKPEKKDMLFNMDWIEDYGLTFQKSICTYYLGKYQESLDACNALLKNPHLPASWRKQVEENMRFPREKLEDLID